MSINNSETKMDEKEFRKMKNKINEQEKIIKKQLLKITSLKRLNEYYKNNEYIIMRNETILKDVIKCLEIFLNLFEMDKIDYIVYGDFFTHLFSNLSVEKTNINILINFHRFEKIEYLLNIFFSLDKIENKNDYNHIKFFINENGSKINFYKLKLIVDNDHFINLVIHDTTELYNIYTTCENFCISNFGIQNIKDKGNDNFYSSKSCLDVLCNIFNLSNKKGNLLYNKNENELINNPSLLNVLCKQNNYIKKSINIINRFTYNIQDCPICLDYKKCYNLECSHNFCLDCIIKHCDNNNYENKNCPLCRSIMKIK